MYQYPYGNTQQLNLDWILNKLKELENREASEAELKSVANHLISLSYNSSASYNVNDIVYNDNTKKLYRCNTATTGEPWDATHWDEILLAPVVSNLVEAVANMSSDDIFNDSNVNGTHITEALNALVSNIRYSNHHLQQQKNGTYASFITIEDTPSDNSDRLASSKAAYNLKNAIEQTDSDIAYIVNGNQSTAAISEGKYVLVRNSTITGVTDGLYIAAQAIPANTVITSAYLTSTTGGGLNQVTPIALGGTGATTKSSARTNLELYGIRRFTFDLAGSGSTTLNFVANSYGFIMVCGNNATIIDMILYRVNNTGNVNFNRTTNATNLSITTGTYTMTITNALSASAAIAVIELNDKTVS